MEIYETISYLIYNFFRIIIICSGGSIFMSKKDINKMWETAFILAFFAVNSLVYLCISKPVLTLISNIVFLVLYTLFYNGKIYMKMFYIAVIFSLALIYEDYLYVVFSAVSEDMTPYTTLIAYILSNAILFATLCLIRKLFSNFKKEKRNINDAPETDPFKTRRKYIIMVVSALICVFLAAVYFPVSSIFTIYGTMVFILLIVLVLFIIYFFYEINRTYKKMYEAQITERENLFYKNQLQVIKEANKQISGINHDFKNHIEAVKYALAKNDIKGCMAYLNELSENITSEKAIVNSGNTVIDSLINYKLRDYKEKNIKADISAAVPESIFVSDYDLNIILGNLIDNALEAVMKSAKRELKIDIKYIFDSLFIKIENTYDGKIIKKDGRLLTTNEDSENHGYGLANAEKTVKRRGGKININITEDVFSVIITLNKSPLQNT